MKGPSFYFQKNVINTTNFNDYFDGLMFFIMFFFVFVSDNIDRTITKQMYELILNRQTPIVGLVDSKQTDSIDDIYAFLASDSVQTNCIIQDGKMNVFSNQSSKRKPVNHKVYEYLLDQSKQMNLKMKKHYRERLQSQIRSIIIV